MSALLLVSACTSGEAPTALLVNPIPQAQLAGVQSLWAQLIVEQNHEEVSRQAAVSVPPDSEAPISLEFSKLPPGTYSFIVQLRGSLQAGAAVDAPSTVLLLEYVRPEVRLVEGDNGTLVAGGAWQLPRADAEGDVDGDGLGNLRELFVGLDPASSWSKLADAPAGTTIKGLAGRDSRALVFYAGSDAMMLRNQEILQGDDDDVQSLLEQTPIEFAGYGYVRKCAAPCGFNGQLTAASVVTPLNGTATAHVMLGTSDGSIMSTQLSFDGRSHGTDISEVSGVQFLNIVPPGGGWDERYQSGWTQLVPVLSQNGLWVGVDQNNVVRFDVINFQPTGGQFREVTTTAVDMSVMSSPVLARSLDVCGGVGMLLAGGSDSGGAGGLYVVQQCPSTAPAGLSQVLGFSGVQGLSGMAVWGNSLSCHAVITGNGTGAGQFLLRQSIAYSSLDQCWPTGSTGVVDDRLEANQLPSGLGSITAVYVGESLHKTGSDGVNTVSALYLGDDQGQIFVLENPPDMLDDVTASSWRALAESPDGAAIVGLATDQRGYGGRPENLVQSLYVATSAAVYRFP